jgi:predicted GNAT family acetyltransferase
VAGAALRTPPRGLLLPALPAGAVASLAAAAEPGLSGASGPAGVVAHFAAAYAARAGATARRGARQRLFELTELRLPADVPGQPRAATEPDVDLCADWLDEFAAAAGVPADRDRTAAARAVAQGRLLLWEIAGAPVAMAGNSPTVRGVTRIGPVFTPPEHRRHGYGAAVTGELARRLQQRGRVVLFADRANPSAVGVYQRLGFRPVGDWDDWSLEY